MNLTEEQAVKIHNAHQRSAPKGRVAAGRAAFEESMRIALSVSTIGEVTKTLKAIYKGMHPTWPGEGKMIIDCFLANRMADYYEPQDRTVERLQKWFETHGHPEFCLDAQPLEQLQAIVIDEYEKRKKEAR